MADRTTRTYKVIVAVTAVLLIFVIFAGLSSLRSYQRDQQRQADLKKIDNFLELYHQKFRRYPDNLDNLAEGGIGVAEIPRDPAYPKRDYVYTVREDRQSYNLEAKFEKQ